MTEMIVKIFIQLISTLAVATKHVKEGRLSESVLADTTRATQQDAGKFGNKVFGNNDVEAVLHRLDRLSFDEAVMTAEETLEIVYGLIENLRNTMSGEQVLFYLSRTLCQSSISLDDESTTDGIQEVLGMFSSGENRLTA
jgi:hypothetical protein